MRIGYFLPASAAISTAQPQPEINLYVRSPTGWEVGVRTSGISGRDVALILLGAVAGYAIARSTDDDR